MSQTTEIKETAQEKQTVLRPHISSSPHVRSALSTGEVMYDVVLSLLPVTVVGVWHNGFHALLIVLMAIFAAVGTEFVFDYVTKRSNTVTDGSAVVTGLLLALILPATVPLYIPFIGSVFAILVVKCLFGGLGKNFVNPALVARCFLLISFGTAMTNYAVDGVSSATPLATLLNDGYMDVGKAFLGFSPDVIGSSVAAMMIGGFYLWVVGGITFHIPVTIIVSFTLFVALFGGKGFDPAYLAANLCSGGVVLGAVFMASDPVTSPANPLGHVIYGAIIGILGGIFRVFGSSTDSFSYAIIAANLFVPLLDEFIVPTPYGLRSNAQLGDRAPKKKISVPKPAVVLTVITLIAGLALSGVYVVTKEPIEKQQMAAAIASYQEVCPDADDFGYDDDINAAVDALGGNVYGADFGKSYIKEVVVGTSGGNTVGYVVSVINGDGYDGNIGLSVGISLDGTVNGISFTELHETAGMGMLCGEPAFKDQFAGVTTDAFVLNKAGGSTADNEIDSVSGASTTSLAVVHAVNAALDFMKANGKGGM